MRPPVDEARLRELARRLGRVDVDSLLREIPGLKEDLGVNIELASPPDFIPELPGVAGSQPVRLSSRSFSAIRRSTLQRFDGRCRSLFAESRAGEGSS